MTAPQQPEPGKHCGHERVCMDLRKGDDYDGCSLIAECPHVCDDIPAPKTFDLERGLACWGYYSHDRITNESCGVPCEFWESCQNVEKIRIRAKENERKAQQHPRAPDVIADTIDELIDDLKGVSSEWKDYNSDEKTEAIEYLNELGEKIAALRQGSTGGKR